MNFGKILVKNDYEEKGDLVFRPLVRAYKKYGLDKLIQSNGVIVFGIIYKDVFYELFTKQAIPIDDVFYEEISNEEVHFIVDLLTLDELKLAMEINNAIIFKMGRRDLIINSMSELANDRYVEYDAFEKSLSSINPYEEPYNGYNDFDYKCRKLEKIKKTM